VEKSGGLFFMECCNFEFCHGNGVNTNHAVHAFTSIDSDASWSDISLFECNDNSGSHTDNAFGFKEGSSNVTLKNDSHCISTGGGICGSFSNIATGAVFSLLQCENGSNNSVVELQQQDQSSTL